MSRYAFLPKKKPKASVVFFFSGGTVFGGFVVRPPCILVHLLSVCALQRAALNKFLLEKAGPASGNSEGRLRRLLADLRAIPT